MVDENNTSGFGDANKLVVAIFTYHNMDKEKAKQIDVETQGIAYSLDNSKTWTKYNAKLLILLVMDILIFYSQIFWEMT